MDEIEIGKKTKKIDLSNKNLNSIPSEIFDITDLEILILTQNQIRAIPASISRLKNLKILDISFNQIKYLPENLFQLKNLESLNLSNNDIQKLSYKITELKRLETLKLKENSLAIPPPEITHRDNCKSSVFLYFEKFKEEDEFRKKLIIELNSNISESIKVNTNVINSLDNKTRFSINKILKEIKLSDSILRETLEIKDFSKTQKELHDVINAYELIINNSKIKFDDDILDKLKNSKNLVKTHKLFESKLIFVGEERAGKTSLT